VKEISKVFNHHKLSPKQICPTWVWVYTTKKCQIYRTLNLGIRKHVDNVVQSKE
jgi:hypothetical protein